MGQEEQVASSYRSRVHVRISSSVAWGALTVIIELVNTVRASSTVAVARTKKVEQEMIDAGLLPAPSLNAATASSSFRDSVASTGSKPDGKAPLDDEEEALRLRLESIGMHVGANVAERYVGFMT